MVNPLSHFHCDSVEEFAEMSGAFWCVDVTQSQPGGMEANLWSRHVGGCEVYRSHATRALLCTGLRSDKHWTITPINRHCAGARFRGQTLADGDLLFLDPGGEVFQQTLAGHAQSAISIPVPIVERIIIAEHQTEPAMLLNQWARKSDRGVTRDIENLLGALLGEPGFPACSFGASATELAAQVIAITQSGSATTFLRSTLANRRRIVTRAEELIRSRLHQPPSVTELCETTFASRRLLFYAFNELLGRSPAVHAKLLRLHACRRNIVASGPQVAIQQIAATFGFRHSGQFSIDYLRAFGERPNETRRRFRLSAIARGG